MPIRECEHHQRYVYWRKLVCLSFARKRHPETCHPVWHGVSVKRVRTWPGVSREITRGPDQTRQRGRAHIWALGAHTRERTSLHRHATSEGGTLGIKCRIFWLLVGELVGKEGERERGQCERAVIVQMTRQAVHNCLEAAALIGE